MDWTQNYFTLNHCSKFMHIHREVWTNPIEVREWWMCGGDCERKDNVQHKIYKSTLLLGHTHYFTIRRKRKQRKSKDLCSYFIAILIALWKTATKLRKVFSLFSLFNFYLRQIKSPLAGVTPSALRLALPSSCNVRHYVTGAYSRIFLFANVELVIWKLNASTMGNLFAASTKSMRALG